MSTDAAITPPSDPLNEFKARQRPNCLEIYDPENDDAWIRSDVTKKLAQH